jgi:NTE family protein
MTTDEGVAGDLDQDIARLEGMGGSTGLTAFVLGGGGSLGATQVGMLQALLESGFRPDLVVGTSIGALNGAYLAGHPDLAGMRSLGHLWSSVRRPDVFRINVRNLLGGFLGRRDRLFEAIGLRRVISQADLGFARLEEAPVPVHVVATDVVTGAAVVLSDGDATDVLMASSAIRAFFRRSPSGIGCWWTAGSWPTCR